VQKVGLIAAAAAAGDFFMAATRGYALSIVAILEALDQGIDQLLVAPILADVEEQQPNSAQLFACTTVVLIF
jgi:hypothetical protein